MKRIIAAVSAAVLCLAPGGSVLAEDIAMPACGKAVVIDAGHGGWDPGMISKSGVEEKDVNLQICEKLQTLLESGGAITLITRAGDDALANRKRGDLSERTAIAEGGADIFLSVHQNSYPEGQAKGPMVFYETKSEGGKALAAALQKELNAVLIPGSKRPPSAKTGYYLLKNSTVPAAIIECGFLSNPAETKLLTTEEYQDKIAWGIYLGVLDYFVDKNALD